MILYQLVIVPLLLLFIWGYIRLRPHSGRGPRMVAYDTAVVLAAVLMSIAAGRWVAIAEPEGSIWTTVVITVSTFHVFPGVLLLGWYLRRRLFR